MSKMKNEASTFSTVIDMLKITVKSFIINAFSLFSNVHMGGCT